MKLFYDFKLISINNNYNNNNLRKLLRKTKHLLYHIILKDLSSKIYSLLYYECNEEVSSEAIFHFKLHCAKCNFSKE